MFLNKRLTSFFIILLAGLITVTSAQAQNSTQPKTVTVTGQLVDSASKEVIPFGSVMLKSTDGEHQFTMGTDSLGAFEFQQVPLGKYTLMAYYVGYPKIERNYNVITSGTTFKMGQVLMAQSQNVLREVQVVAMKDLIKSRPDGIEYDASKDPTNRGTDAADVLRKVPMLTVDEDDNLQLRGNGNVKVYIDGKPSSIIGSSISDVLKQIPSDNIQSVQVITSPGARYDAEGSAGVVNIITKHKKVSGISGRVFSGVTYNFEDKQARGFGGVGLNYRHNKFGLSANLGGGHWSFTSKGSSTRSEHLGTPEESILQQNTFTKGGGSFLWSRLSADYTFDTLNSVSLGVSFRPGNWTTDINQSTLFPAQGLDYDQTTHQTSPRKNYGINASYNRKFAGHPGRTLDFLSIYTINNGKAKYDLSQLNQPENALSYEENNVNNTQSREFTFQADYTHPLNSHNQKIETGVKYTNRDVNSDYVLQTRAGQGMPWAVDPSRTNELDYMQQVAAGYGQYSVDLNPKWSLIAGARYEFTNIKGHLRDNGGSFQSNFNNFLPSAILSYKVRDMDQLNLSYNQRIERPSIQFINPYTNSSDPLNISSGNPELKPEQVHKVELNYNMVIGNGNVNAALFYSHTKDGIEAFTEVNEDGVAVTQYGNYGKDNTVGLNLFGGTNLFNRWRINLNGNLYHRSLSGSSIVADNKGWEYDVRFNSDVKVYNNLSVSGFAMYRGRQVGLQGTRSGWYRYSLGLKQTIMKGRADITLAAVNFLAANTKSTSHYVYGDAVYDQINYRQARGFRVGFSINFGKMNFKGDQQRGNGQKAAPDNDLKKKPDSEQQQQSSDGAGQMG